jgi:hypothetical protein
MNKQREKVSVATFVAPTMLFTGWPSTSGSRRLFAARVATAAGALLEPATLAAP